jgi:hypothetical protein
MQTERRNRVKLWDVPPRHVTERRIPAVKQAKQLDDLFEAVLKDIYYAETKILTALPKMAKAAQSPDLKAAFEKHERETEGQLERLEKVFGLLDQTPKGKKCEAIEGLVKEGQEGKKEFKGSPALAAALLATGKPSSTTKFLATALSSPGPIGLICRRPPSSCDRRWMRKRIRMRRSPSWPKRRSTPKLKKPPKQLSPQPNCP